MCTVARIYGGGVLPDHCPGKCENRESALIYRPLRLLTPGGLDRKIGFPLETPFDFSLLRTSTP